MTKPTHVPALPAKLAALDDDALLARLGELAAELTANRAQEANLLDERLAIFGALVVDRGVTQVKVADHAKVTPMAVAFALRPPEQRRSRKPPAKPGKRKAK